MFLLATPYDVSFGNVLSQNRGFAQHLESRLIAPAIRKDTAARRADLQEQSGHSVDEVSHEPAM